MLNIKKIELLAMNSRSYKLVVLTLFLVVFHFNTGFSQNVSFGALTGRAFVNNDAENKTIIDDYNSSHFVFQNIPYVQRISSVRTSNLNTNVWGGFFEYKQVGIEVFSIHNTYNMVEIIPDSTYGNRNFNISQHVFNFSAYYKFLKHFFIHPYLGTGLQLDNTRSVDKDNQVSTHAKINFLINSGLSTTVFKRITLKVGYTYSLNTYVYGGIGVCF
ncbi:MAG: hypothetical protein KGO81_04845 [Bacteroidota bacterium]|nr:hypothetical protein [Bacteroidota bacterium]